MIRIIILLLLPITIFCQNSQVTLDELLTRLDTIYPIAKNIDAYNRQLDLTLKKLNTQYYPNINFNTQATYQSDVTQLNINFPEIMNIDIPQIDKDQYKIYLEVNQLVLDGGRQKQMKAVEKLNYSINNKSDEVELYKVKLKLSEIYFSIIKLKKTAEVLEIRKDQLNNQLSIIESGIKNGIMTGPDSNELKAEIISTKQKILEIKHQESALIKTLNILTANKYDTTTVFTLPNPDGINFIRPEQEFFNLSKQKLEAQSYLLQKNRYPMLFVFGQVGYGKPGLNMLSNDFTEYYIAGVKITWNIFDWNKTKYDRQNLLAGINIIDNKLELFNQSVSIDLIKQNEEIEKLEKIIKQDEQIISLREEIVKSSESKLKNGVIRPNDYITDLNNSNVAKINYEIHKIDLVKAKVTYKLIKTN